MPVVAQGMEEEACVGGCIVPDGVVGSETNPLGDGTVLLLGLGQLDLGPETLVALLVVQKCDGQPSCSPSIQRVQRAATHHRPLGGGSVCLSRGRHFHHRSLR